MSGPSAPSTITNCTNYTLMPAKSFIVKGGGPVVYLWGRALKALAPEGSSGLTGIWSRMVWGHFTVWALNIIWQDLKLG